MKRNNILILILTVILFTLPHHIHANTDSLTPSEEFFLKGDYEKVYLNNLKLATDNPQEAYLPLLISRDISKQFLSRNDSGKEILKRLNTSTALSPLSKNLVWQMLASIYSSEGDEFQASDLRRMSGIVPTWRIAGAFGKYDKSSFYQTFAPEGDIDFSIFMQGLGKDVTWRLLSESVCLNSFKPYKWISPQRGILYLYTQFKLPEDETIILEKNGNCAFTFWIDGIECNTSDFMQEETGSTIRFKSPTQLNKGWHRLLIKLYSDDKNSSEIFRILNQNFEPVNNIEYDLKQLRGNNRFGKELWDTVTIDTANLTPAELALCYQYNNEYDKALSYWKKAITSDPENPALRIYYATCAAQAVKILPGPMRNSIIRRETMKALELDPEAASALIILGDHERQNNRFERANDYYSKAIQINPNAIIAYTSKIRIALENNWKSESTLWLNQLGEIYPDSYIHLLLKSIYYNDLGQISKAASILEEAYYLDKSNITVGIDCIKSYFASGNTDKALEIIESLPIYYKQRIDIILLNAQILSRAGKNEAAEQLLKQSLQTVGSDPEILKIQGDILFSAKDYEKAKTYYTKSLELDPGNYSLRHLIDELEGKNYQFWNAFTLNTNEKIDEFIKKHTEYSGSTARLIDQTVLTLHEGGGYSNYTHEVQAVLTESGVNTAAVVDTYGELLQARTIIPEKGRTLEPIILKNSSDITMPAVAPGAIIEHTYLSQRETPADRQLRFPKWYFRSPSSQESFLFSQYVIRVPKGVDFIYAERNLKGQVDFTITEDDDGTKNYIWTGIDMPQAIHEEGSPAISSTLPYVAIALTTDWNDINSSMITAYLGKTISTIDIDNRVKELLKDCNTNNEAISRIYNFVNSYITPSGSKSPANHVLLQRSGDKKLLLLSMLESAGIKAHLVAARPPANILYSPVWKLPSDNSFIDYLLIAEGDSGEYIWLDPRARYAGAGEIGEDLCGGTGFILGLDKCEFVTIPQSPESRYTIISTRDYYFNENNSTELSGTINFSGTRSWEFKENLVKLNTEQKLGVIEKILSKSIFGISVTQFSTPEITTPGTNLMIKFSADISDFLRKYSNNTYGIPLALSRIKLLPERNANNRKTPYHLSNFVAGHDRFTYHLPDKSSISQLPEDIVICSKFGHYSLCFSQENNQIILERKYNFQPQTISLTDWKEYFELSRIIDELENTHILFHNAEHSL